VVSVAGKSLAVKVRVYPGDFKIDLIECLTVNDRVLTLKRRIYDMSVSSRAPPAQNDVSLLYLGSLLCLCAYLYLY